MSEEQSQDHNDGTWSGLKKTIVGTISTAVLGAGTWFTTTFFGGHKEDKEEPKTEQAAPAAQPTIVINNTQQQQQPAGGGTKVIERVVEKPAVKSAEPAPKKKEFTEEPKW